MSFLKLEKFTFIGTLGPGHARLAYQSGRSLILPKTGRPIALL